MSSRRRGEGRSIDISNESDASGDEMDQFEIADTKAESFWSKGGNHRAFLIQTLLDLSNKLVVLNSVLNEELGIEEKVYYKEESALEEATGLLKFLLDYEDLISRDLIIQIQKYLIMSQKIIPLYSLTLYDRPIDSSRKKFIENNVRPKKGKETKSESAIRVASETKLQQNTYEQISALIYFKSCIVTEEVFRILLFHTFHSLQSDERTREENIVVECTLTLISQLLQISSGPLSSEAEIAESKRSQTNLILLLQGEYLDILLLLCTSISEKDNKPWSVIVLEIIQNIFKSCDVKELLQVQRATVNVNSATLGEKSLGSNINSNINSNGRSLVGKPPLHKAVVRTGLSSQVQHDRNKRMDSCNAVGSRISRFGGVFTVPGKVIAIAPADDSEGGPTVMTTSASKIVRDTTIFTDRTGSLSRSESGLMKKNARANRATYVTKNKFLLGLSSDNMISLKDCSQNSEHEALCVIAEFMEAFMKSGFCEIVISIKEMWRRGDMMSHQEELCYFSLVAKCIKYQALKLAQEKSKMNSDNATAGNVTVSAAMNPSSDGSLMSQPWLPEMKNITLCFDRMSLVRPIDMLVNIREKKMDVHEMCIPMELHKQNIIVLRLMLESDNIAHNEIALASMYRLFYMVEKNDPLPALVRDWMPGKYSKTHMYLLVELVHETLKLLDTGDYCFRKEVNEDTRNEILKKKKKSLGNEGERSLYLGHALQFDTSSYFSKLVGVSFNTVRFYIRVLDLYADNPTNINHYVYIFIKRLCEYKIESDNDDAHRNSLDASSGGVSLGHMLFNIQALAVFNKLLNDVSAIRNRELHALVRLVQNIVRQFGELAMKNKLLFVEALFTHFNPSKAWTRIDSVYDAVYYSKGTARGSSHSHSHSIRDEREGSGVSSDDWGEEYDENDPTLMAAVVKEKRLRRKDDVGARARKSNKNWSDDEVKCLRQLYELYAGSASVFDTISHDAAFRECSGGKRTAKHIEKKVQELQLHLQRGDTDSEVEEKSVDDNVSSGESDEETSDVQAGDVTVSGGGASGSTTQLKRSSLTNREKDMSTAVASAKKARLPPPTPQTRKSPQSQSAEGESSRTRTPKPFWEMDQEEEGTDIDRRLAARPAFKDYVGVETSRVQSTPASIDGTSIKRKMEPENANSSKIFSKKLLKKRASSAASDDDDDMDMMQDSIYSKSVPKARELSNSLIEGDDED